jgi:hypothetical protein
MTYDITKQQYELAKQIGVKIFPSDKKKYKLDVYEDGIYCCSIGDSKYNDYFIYLQTKGEDYANERRRLYGIRHSKDLQSERGFLAGRLLWAI